jgi:methylmalonyl-CoA/ethylmalonyl-CoA epimerase
MSEPEVGAMDHVAVAVADADEAAANLVELLGLVVVGDELVTAAGVRLVYLARPAAEDDTQLQLVQPVKDGPVARFLTERGEGLHHVCFRTGDVHQALRRMQQHERGVFRGGREKACAFLESEPHGLRIELTQWSQSDHDVGKPQEGERSEDRADA